MTLILAPIFILAICVAHKTGVIVLPQSLRALTIFVLLIAFMVTGMPVSIALGLTVLTFLFILTDVPIEAVSMKLFTGLESFEIMAIPFFILAGNFLSHGGVARRMIDFAVSLIGHWHGGLGLAGIVACAMFALVCGSSVATVAAIGAIVLPEMVRHGYPMRFGAGIITVAGSLGILMLPSIPKIVYAVSTNTSIGALFVAGLLPGSLLTVMLCTVTWFLAQAAKLSAHGESELGAGLARVPRKHLGPDAGRHHHRRHLQRLVHRHRGGRDGCRLFLLHRGLRLQGDQVRRRAARAAARRQYQRDAALHHHQRGVVLLRAVERKHSLRAGRLDHRAESRLVRIPDAGQRIAD